MRFDRRGFLMASLASAAAACRSRLEQRRSSVGSGELGIPGPYPGRVIGVRHRGSIADGRYQAEPVRQMMERGMTELTGADSWADAWRRFVEPGEVVGIKLNPVGQPFLISDREVVQNVVDGLVQAGIRKQDIVAYDRYGEAFKNAGFDRWLPGGVRWTSASLQYQKYQLDMEGYDRDSYLEIPLVHPDYAEQYGARFDDPHLRRSYVARFISREVDKLINLCVLKHHQSAGVTLALKNLSHGLVNNVNRSHVTETANACGFFIPAVVDLPVMRRKTVLNILDGVKAAYHGGPGRRVEKYVWEHRTLYFATDPVALDKTGWKVIDVQREAFGFPPIALLKPDEDSRWLNCQVEHIELAGNLGLGVYDDEKIEVKRIDLV